MESFILLDYATLRVIWWALLGFLLVGFAVMDGFDLGVASLLPVVARTDTERRIVINVVGPVWEGNQVWLILGGGAVFAAWPLLYAMAFSGFYLAMLLLLVALILRPVGFKYRSKIADPRWRSGWDWVLCLSGVVAALVFGVAVGNVMLGVPFWFDPATMRPIYEGGFLDLFTPFPLLCGVLSVTMLIMHGAAMLCLKTRDAVAARAAWAIRAASTVTMLLFAAGGVWVFHSIPGYVVAAGPAGDAMSNPLAKTVVMSAGAWLQNFSIHPWFWLAPAAGLGGALVALLCAGLRWRWLSFLGSSSSVAGIVLTFGFAMFPFLLPSSRMPSASLTIWDASASHFTLWIMLLATAIFMPLILAYTAWVYRVMRGPVTARTLEDAPHAY